MGNRGKKLDRDLWLFVTSHADPPDAGSLSYAFPFGDS